MSKSTTCLMIDPPGGWNYGFPSPILPWDEKNFQEFLLSRGYPRGDLELANKYSRYWDTSVDLEVLQSYYRILIPSKVREVMQALLRAGHQVFVVGGSIRDVLIGKKDPKDWDLATSAPPEEAWTVLGKEFVVVPTGIEYGTISVVNKGETVEVTTFRSDMECDGRRASVKYSESLEEDSERRDLTINAIYADVQGRLFDPQGGIEDIFNKRIRFVGDPRKRIKEDTLRVLRAMRFALQYDFNFDPETYEVLRGLPGSILFNLSEERIISEISRFNLKSDNAKFVLGAGESFVNFVFKDRLMLSYLRDIREIDQDVPWFVAFWWLGVGLNWFKSKSTISRKIVRQLQIYEDVDLNDDPYLLAYRHGLEATSLIRSLYAGRSTRLPVQYAPPLLAREVPSEVIPVPLNGYHLKDYFSGPQIGKILDVAVEIWSEYRYDVPKEKLLRIVEHEYKQKYGEIIDLSPIY